MNDVYYNPEDFGLTVVAEMEWTEPCYDFNLTVAWKDKDGNLYWASDSGCSCPSPFEDYTSLDSLNTGTKWELLSYLDQEKEYNSSYEEDDRNYGHQQLVKFIEKVMTNA